MPRFHYRFRTLPTVLHGRFLPQPQAGILHRLAFLGVVEKRLYSATSLEAMLDRIAPAVYNASFIYECLRFHRTSTRPSGHPLGCNVYGAEDERTVRDG